MSNFQIEFESSWQMNCLARVILCCALQRRQLAFLPKYGWNYISGILTVRFTYRGSVIRIFGAGYWRKGKAIYEHENQIHR